MKILPNGVAVTGTTHHTEWCAGGLGLIHDRWFADQMLEHVQPGDMVVEGGAHIGTLTRALIDYGCIVTAIEPNPDAVLCLKHNCPEITPLNFALSDEPGKAKLWLQENAGMSHLSDKGTVDVTIETLDRLLPYADVKLLKLDVEGYELKALMGGMALIDRCSPALVLEVNAPALLAAGNSQDELLDYIEQLGYTARILQPQCNWGDEQYDVVCVRE